ncbi:MAG: DUF4405 domain-containing protein [Clostridia bacterium]|nr:DUF4405 domain-containing protein [Clostridia bacterium]
MLLFLLMYRLDVVSLAFHEVFGLVVLGLILLHLLYNYRWLVQKSRAFFSRKMAVRQRVSYILFFLLLVDLFLIGLSGLYISKIYFYFPANRFFWKAIHYSCSAWALVLLGLHTGMHWLYIKSVFKRFLPLPKKLFLPLGYALLLALCTYACYNLLQTDFLRWLTMPALLYEQNTAEQAPSLIGEESTEAFAPFYWLPGAGKGLGKGHQKSLFPLRIYWPNIVRLWARFGSIVVLFAALEYHAEKLSRLRRRKNLYYRTL